MQDEQSGVLQCNECKQKYVGESKNALHIAMNGIRPRIEDEDTKLAVHFRQDGHSMEVMGIETGFKDDKARQAAKHWWITTLETKEHGLNERN